jgi:hypothetical protein
MRLSRLAVIYKLVADMMAGRIIMSRYLENWAPPADAQHQPLAPLLLTPE